MKFAKKFLSIFVATVFLVQSLAFTPAFAAYPGEEATSVEGNNPGYTRTANMKVSSPGTGSGTGVSSISCEQIGNKLNWTVNLSDGGYTLLANKVEGGFHPVVIRPGLNMLYSSDDVSSVNYTAINNNDQKVVTGNLTYDLASKTEKEVIPAQWASRLPTVTGSLSKQTITFTTEIMPEINFQFSLISSSNIKPHESHETLLVTTVNIKKDKTDPPGTPVNISLSGEVHDSEVQMFIKQEGTSGHGSEYNVNFKNQSDNTYSVYNGLQDGKYSITFSKSGYTFNPEGYIFTIAEGKITNSDGEEFTDNTITTSVKKDDTGGTVEPAPLPVSPVDYTTDEENGTYPEHYINPKDSRYPEGNPYIRNVNTEYVKNNLSTDNYKIEYGDSTVGKWAETTNTDDHFFVNLTVKGKQYNAKKGLDVVFVLDNSYSMIENFCNEQFPKVEYTNTKLYSLSTNIAKIERDLLAKNFDGTQKYDIRVGTVNFSTMSEPVDKPQYPFDYGTLRSNVKTFYENNFSQNDYSRIYNFLSDNTKTQFINYFTHNSNQQALTNSLSDSLFALPMIPRGGNYQGGNYEDLLNGRNWGIRADGQTNVAAGINQGTEELYKSGEDRNKVMVIVSDGIPTASFRLNSLNMTGDFNSNLRKTPDTLNIKQYYGSNTILQNQVPALINTNSVPFRINNPVTYDNLYFPTYKTDDGDIVFNNYQGTDAVRNYYTEKHKDMRIISVLIGDYNKYGWEFGNDPYAGDYGTAEQYLKKGQYYPYNYVNPGNPGTQADSMKTYPDPGDYFKSLATPGDNNYYNVKTAQELTKTLINIEEDIIKTINNGTVIDPMGENIILMTDKNGNLKPGGKPTDNKKALADGKYYLSNNLGQYLGTDGKVYDASGTILPDSVPSTLRGVTVTKETVTSKDGKTHDQIRINHLTLGEDEEITLKYRVKLDTEAKDFRYNYYYQANQPTTLYPTPGGEGRAFPIPSVCGTPPPTGCREFIKIDAVNKKGLEGAVFAVYRLDKNEQKEYLTEVNGVYTWVPEQTPVVSIPDLKRLTSGHDGKFEIYGLVDGTYYLQEIAAPTGYELIKEPIPFDVKWCANMDPVVIVNVRAKLPVLPDTGGRGTTSWYWAAGLVIMLIAGALLLKKYIKNQL